VRVQNLDDCARESDTQQHHHRLIFSRNELIELLFPAWTVYTIDG
jgi:hypothetical protein